MFIILKQHENGVLQIEADTTHPTEDVVKKKAEELTIETGEQYIVAKLLYRMSQEIIVNQKNFDEE